VTRRSSGRSASLLSCVRRSAWISCLCQLVTVHRLDGIEAHAMASYNDSTLR
jgi:hypothetical protein